MPELPGRNSDGHASTRSHNIKSQVRILPATPPSRNRLRTHEVACSAMIKGVPEPALDELEVAVLEICAEAPWLGETTTEIDEEHLEASPGRARLEFVLRGLEARGLLKASGHSSPGPCVLGLETRKIVSSRMTGG